MEIDSALKQSSGTTQVIVRLQDAGVESSADIETTVNKLKSHAETTQRSVLAYAKRTEGVEVVKKFWLTNAVLLEVDKSQVDLDELAKESYVTKLHANFNVKLPGKVSDQSVTATTATTDSSPDTTYGVDQINATEVWDSYGTKGSGVNVAVLDTGVDPDHPDIDLYTNDSSDPTYPGGWAEFNENGNIVPGSEPRDTGSHGTHTSGTVAGGNASGEYIGVAPNVNLMHGLVLPDGGGSFAQLAGGMEWAVNNGADVISMSLGAEGYYSELIEPVRNAQDAGVVVVTSSGNNGAGTSGSPGNVYESIAIGATDSNVNIASFSSGEEVDTSADWGSAAPASWPDSYVVPDASAAGAAVKSALPGGNYGEKSGTSMAAPHAAGTVALMLSASGTDLAPQTIKSALYDSAWKPAGEPSGNDTRYGAGVIDAKAATDLVALENGVTGQVTNESGAPISGATVSLNGTSASATTGPNGEYTVLAAEGQYTVTVSKTGYETTSATVSVPNGTFVSQNFSLTPTVTAQPVLGQPDAIEGGNSFTVTVEASNLESATIDLAGNYSADDATLYVNGEQTVFGETVEFAAPYTGKLAVRVETTAETEGNISLEHTFSGLGNTITATTGPTQVYETYTRVAVVDDGDEGWGGQVATALESDLPSNFNVTAVSSDTALETLDRYDGFVVQNIAGGNAAEFTEKTEDRRFGVVYLDQAGSDSNGIQARSAATGDPASVSEDPFGEQPVVYEVTNSHPILNGAAAEGETVRIHSGAFGDHDWFKDTDATVLANVGDQAGIKGSGFAVEEESMTVLASALGRNSFVGNSDYTETANKILANAVQFTATGGNPVGDLTLSEQMVQPGSEASIELSTDATDVAGYQANITFDPSVVNVTGVNGIDFADPVVNVNNEEGWVYISQARATNLDGPRLAELTFNATTNERSAEANLTFATGDTLLNAENASTRYVNYEPGRVTVAKCSSGDVNGDGAVTSADATLTQRYIVGESISGSFNQGCADMNGDGVITSADVTAILQKIVSNNQQSMTNEALAN